MDREQTIAALREIEVRFAMASGVPGSAAIDSIRAAVVKARESEPDITMAFKIVDAPLIELFYALCARYRLNGRRASKHTRGAYAVAAPRSFAERIFVPLFQEASAIVLQDLVRETHVLIKDAYQMTTDRPNVTIKLPSK